MKKEELVSIIIPVYNAEKFIAETIENILEQTYQNYEIILVDDYSSDRSVEIIEKYKEKDKRIIIIKKKKNEGPALTRNRGIKQANGKYICFQDADDKWEKDKIEKQVKFMKKNKCAFSFTNYEFADQNCIPLGKKVIVPKTITYKQALKNTTISTITVMFDMTILTKKDIYMKNIKSEDTALWWKLLRTKVEKAYGIQNVFSYYRRTKGTLSSNKFEAIKRIWNLYRKEEKLNVFQSMHCFIFYAIRATLRRL